MNDVVVERDIRSKNFCKFLQLEELDRRKRSYRAVIGHGVPS